MIIGIGTDITELARIKASYDRFGERFLQKILTPDELKLVPESPIAYISGRFAAKEALSILKCYAALRGSQNCIGTALHLRGLKLWACAPPTFP